MLRLTLLPGLICLLMGCAAGGATLTPPLPNAHAHNDYEHARPLLDALEHGFCSIEADVWLADGKLLVAHNRSDLKVERSLTALYLDPLRERVRKNGGRVFPGGPSVTLMIDFKTEAETTYAGLRATLKEYHDILTRFTPTNTMTNAVTVIVSGNRPIRTMAAEPERYAAVDGRLADLPGDFSPHLMPLISDNWNLHFKWRGTGALPSEEREKLRSSVMRAHQQGRRIRFWATADLPSVWQELRASGADLINTDDLAGLRAFLLP